MQCAELSWKELDLVILGQISAFLPSSSSQTSSSRRPSTERHRMAFHHHGVPVCRETFLKLHGIGLDRFKNVKASYLATGLTPRIHGNTRRQPKNALKIEEIKNLLTFLYNYAENNAILLPGRIPGYKRDNIQLLPSSTTKKAVWIEYKLASDEADIKAAAYTTFTSLWRQLAPHITVMKPMSDLCWVCQQNSVKIMRAANTPPSAKSQVLKDAEEHLQLATQERSFYRSAIDAAKETLKKTFTVDGHLQVPPIGSCLRPACRKIEMHFSFDMAQQVHYPSDPQQPGPIKHSI